MRWFDAITCLLLILCTVTPQLATAQLDDPGAEPGMISQDLYNKDRAIRARAAREAGAKGERQAIGRLMELLRDEAWIVRLAAVQALERLQARQALRSLMVLAQTDFNPEVRKAAAGAVKSLDPKRFVEKLATSDPPPVIPAPEPEPSDDAPLAGRGRAVLVASALALNGLRADETFSGQVAAGLRWAHLDLQLTLNFPAMALLMQGRINLVASFWLVPYLGLGVAISYNNGDETASGPAASLVGGGGVRVGPFGRPDPEALTSRLYGYAEVLVSWVMTQPTPPNHEGELETLALPVMVGIGVELWP